MAQHIYQQIAETKEAAGDYLTNAAHAAQLNCGTRCWKSSYTSSLGQISSQVHTTINRMFTSILGYISV